MLKIFFFFLDSTDLVPAVIVPDKRQVVGNFEGTIFIEESQFTAASWSSS